jgi:hypothetical protein
MNYLEICITELAKKAQEANCPGTSTISEFHAKIKDESITTETALSLIKENIAKIPTQHLEQIKDAISSECADFFNTLLSGEQESQAQEGL